MPDHIEPIVKEIVRLPDADLEGQALVAELSRAFPDLTGTVAMQKALAVHPTFLLPQVEPAHRSRATVRALHHLPPSLPFCNWSSDRYGTTPWPLLLSMMILSAPPRTRSMVSKYMRLRVTSGAFLYSS
jgi:hypothetical protein